MAEDPIRALSADGVYHEFPAGTDIDVVDRVMKGYAESLKPQEPEVPSGTAKGIAKALGQGALALPGELTKAGGAMTQAAGVAVKSAAENAQDLTRAQRGIMDRIDAGEAVKPTDDPMGYADANAEQRRAMRVKLENDLLQMKPAGETGLGAAGDAIKSVGRDIVGAGQRATDWADRTVPLTDEEKSRETVQIAQGLTKILPYMAAGAVGGAPGVIAYGAVDTFGRTFEDAKKSGASDEDASVAAAINGVLGGGMNAVPPLQALKFAKTIPDAFKGKFVQTLTESVKSGATFTGFAEVTKIVDNLVAKESYDPSRAPARDVGEGMGVSFATGAILPMAGAAMSVRRRSPAETVKPVLEAETVDQAIVEARNVVEGAPVDVTAFANEAREYGGRADQEQAQLLELFGGLNRGDVVRTDEGTFAYRTTDEAGKDTTIPLKVWDQITPREEGAPPTVSPDLVAAQRDHYEKMGVRVVYFENDPAIPFDGAVDPGNPNTIFLSNDPSRNAAQVGAHELTHVLESTVLPDGKSVADVLHGQVMEGMTSEGWRVANERFGAGVPERAAFPEGREGDSAHADATLRHLVTEMGADIGGEAPKFQDFVTKVTDRVEQRYGTEAAKNVMQKLIAGIQQAMRTMRDFFFRPEEGAEYGQPETQSQRWVTNLNEIHDTLARGYVERFGTQAERENASLAAMRDAAARERAAPDVAPAGQDIAAVAPEVRPLPEEPLPVRAVTPTETPTAAPGETIPAVEATPEALPPAAEPPQAVHEVPVVEPPPAEQPAAVVAAPDAPISFVDRLKAEKETVWNDKAIMGRVQRGLARNEQFANDVARERIMREDAAPLIRRAIEQDGIPAEDIAEISKLYKQEDGESVEVAFDRAIDRWVTKIEAEGARIEEDAYTYDWLKSEGGTDPVIAEMFNNLEEMYTGLPKKVADADDLPFTSDDPRGAVARSLEEPAPTTGRPEGAENRGQAGDRSEAADKADAKLDGPQFSPRRRADTEPPDPTLLETRAATPDELAARQRARDKETAEALMRGKQRGREGQEAADDLPLFGGDRQGTLLSPRITGENKTREYSPEQKAAFENVGRAVESRGLRDWIEDNRPGLGKRMLVAALDPYAGVKENDPKGYIALRNAHSTAASFNAFLTEGTLKFDGSAYNMASRNGGVENNLVRPLGPEAHDFMSWVAANRAERLKAEDRENLFKADDIAALKSLNRGQLSFDYTLANGKTTRNREAAYMDSLKKLDTFNRNVLDLAVESGLLKRDDVDAKWSNPFYVPFYRQAETDKHFVGPSISTGFVKQNAFKSLKGGKEKLNADLWENAFGNWEHMIDASLRNRAARQVLDTAANPGAEAARKMTAQEVAKLSDKELKAQTVWVMEDGKKVHYAVEDPMMLKAISALDQTDRWGGKAMDVGRWFKRVLTQGITADPLFVVRNLIRDTEQSIAVAPLSYNIPKNLYTGFKQNDLPGALKNVARAVAAQELKPLDTSAEAASLMAGGGIMRLGHGTDTGVRKNGIATMLDSSDKIEGLWKYVSRTAKAYKEVTGQAEDATRQALYKKLRDEGIPHDEASFAARDLMDFTLKGTSQVVRGITDLVPFMNAWMQGLYKTGRAAADSDRNVVGAVGSKVAWQSTKRVAYVLGTVAALNLALDAIYADDPDYQRRDEYDRNSNFWFKIGKTEFRIPMGFEVAAMARIAANGAEAFYDKNMSVDRFIKNTLSILGTNMSLNPTPQIVKPLLDIAANETRTGSPIEGKGMERLRSDERYTINNTLAARGASSALNTAARAVAGAHAEVLSPVQIDYLVQAYGGWLATSALGVADKAIRSFTSEPAKPEKDLMATITRGMIRNDPAPGDRYINLLYEQAKGIESAFASFQDMIKQGRADEAKAFFDENKDLIKKHGMIGSVLRLEGDLNRQIRLITNSPDPAFTPEKKKLMIMELQAAKRQAARNVMEARN